MGDNAAVRAERAIFLGLGAVWLASPARAESPSDELITAQVDALPGPSLAPGQAGELSLVVLESPDRGLPLAVRIDASGLELLDNRLGWSAVVDPLAIQPRLRAQLRAPAAPGDYVVEARVEYWVCREQWCRRKTGRVAWTVVVEGE